MASPPHMDDSIVFARRHQCAPPSNKCFLGTTQVHNPNGISIGSAVFAQLTADCPYTSQRAVLSSQHCPVALWIWTPSNTYRLQHGLQLIMRV